MNKTPYTRLTVHIRLFGHPAHSLVAFARLVIILVMVAALLPVQAVSAVDGDLEDTFLAQDTGGADGYIGSMAVQADGKILIAGDFWHVGGLQRPRLARLNSDGSLDTAYRGSAAGPDYAIYAVEVQPDGKTLVAGRFTTFDGQPRTHIARLNTNGTLDTTFNVTIPGGTDTSVNTIALIYDGLAVDILIGGVFSEVNGVARGNIARLNPDGTLDQAFMQNLAGANGQVQAITVQPDHKILIGGNFSAVNTSLQNRIARLEYNGELDAAFNKDQSGADDIVSAIAVQSGDKILVGGYFSTFNGQHRRGLVRLLGDGTPDTTYINAVSVGNDDTAVVRTIQLQSDGKALIGGFFTTVNGTPRGRLARINTDGTLDTTFMDGKAGANESVLAFEQLSGGKLLVAGSFTQMNGVSRGRIARLNTFGTLDSTFLITGADGEVNAIAVQADGKILIGGTFGVVNGLPRSTLARFNVDGTLDKNFLYNMSGPNNTVNAIILQPDGKILIGGNFTIVNDQGCDRIARLNPDGSPDTTFTCTGFGGTNGEVFALLLLPDGSVLAGGHFTTAGDDDPAHLARFKSNGWVDTFFPHASLGGTYPVVYGLARQEDGKIIVVGDFTVTGTAPERKHVLRLNADGGLDGTYLNGGVGPSNVVRWVDLDAQDNAIIGGWFTQVNGGVYKRVARLNKTNGSPDQGFLSAVDGPDNGVRALAVQPDGKILVGGEFTDFNGVTRKHIARLNSNGTLDTSFTASAQGINNIWVNAIAIQNDQHVLIGGNFTAVNGQERGRIARLENGYRVYLPAVVR